MPASNFDPRRERYIGDGLYVSFDGFMFKLRAPRIDGDHWVGLEPDVLKSFTIFCDETLQWCKAQRNES